MSKRQWLCVLGVWTMIFLFLGFPSLWHKVIAVVTGLIVVFISYRLPADTTRTTESFIENKQP